MSEKLENCRICSSTKLQPLLSLGEMSFTGIFPKTDTEEVPSGPLELIKCAECDLVQLQHSFSPSDLYGSNYGYRSGLNGSMVRHLNSKIADIVKKVDLQSGDLVIDVGSNDGTTLRAYPELGLKLLGVDPSGEKFRSYYPSDVKLIPDFFSASRIEDDVGTQKAKIITSIAMFYDLEDPSSFVKDIASVLAPDGVWVFEQSYLKSMLDTNSYDTICHEHLEYYGLKQIDLLLKKANLKILDVEFNDVNGGSFSITAGHEASPLPPNQRIIDEAMEKEISSNLFSLDTFKAFSQRVLTHRMELRNLFGEIKASHKKVIGYGASTKGNVLLQYCGIGPTDLTCIAEVNEDKFGAFTPGSKIPIVSEEAARRMAPDFFFCLPWHFRNGILKRESQFLESGGSFIFPLPAIESVKNKVQSLESNVQGIDNNVQ